LEKILGHKVFTFCYPRGRYNENIKKIVRKCGILIARTVDAGSFELPKDPYEWPVTLHASNGNLFMTLKILIRTRIHIKSLFNWEIRAKLLFDCFLE